MDIPTLKSELARHFGISAEELILWGAKIIAAGSDDKVLVIHVFPPGKSPMEVYLTEQGIKNTDPRRK